MASFQSVLFFQAFMVEEEDVSKSVMHHAFGEDPKKSFLWRFLSNFYVDEVIFWDGIEEDVCGRGGGEERRKEEEEEERTILRKGEDKSKVTDSDVEQHSQSWEM